MILSDRSSPAVGTPKWTVPEQTPQFLVKMNLVWNRFGLFFEDHEDPSGKVCWLEHPPLITSLWKSPGRTCFIPLGRFAEASEVQMKINQGDFCRFAGIAKSNEGDYGLPWHISSVRLVSFAFSVEDGTMYPYTVRTYIYIYINIYMILIFCLILCVYFHNIYIYIYM